MNEELEIALLKNDFKKMYKDIGYRGCLTCLYEMILGAEILTEVIISESEKEIKGQKGLES